MKTATHPLLILLVGTILSSCGLTTYKTSDPRFNQIFGKEIHSIRPLRLYRLDQNLTEDTDNHRITEGYFSLSETDNGEIGVLPSGQLVKFDKLKRTHSIDGGSEYLVGTTSFRGKTYPVSYWLGLTGDESNAGWKGIYLSFEMPKPRG